MPEKAEMQETERKKGHDENTEMRSVVFIITLSFLKGYE